MRLREVAKPLLGRDDLPGFGILAAAFSRFFGFDLIRLSASRTEIVVQQQSDLDTHVHDNDELTALIDRIVARVGSHRVVVHLPQDTHIPERAVWAAPAQHHLAAATQAVWPARAAGEPPLRPLRLFERPEQIQVIAEVPDGPPARSSYRLTGKPRLTPPWLGSSQREVTALPRV